MPLFFFLDYSGFDAMAFDRQISKRKMNGYIRTAMFDTADFWHRSILLRHFTKNARHRYGYQKRKRGYSEIKRKFAKGLTVRGERHRVVKNGVADLAFEGDSERKSRRFAAIRGLTTGFTIKMTVPKYLVQRRRNSYPDMKREVGTATITEGREMTAVAMASFKRSMKRNRVRRRFPKK